MKTLLWILCAVLCLSIGAYPLMYLIDDGKRIADSELITEYLDGMTGGKVYEGLDVGQRAYGVALARLAEDHLYWLMVASRWLEEAW